MAIIMIHRFDYRHQRGQVVAAGGEVVAQASLAMEPELATEPFEGAQGRHL
jgi:hypothetical protein